MIRSVFTMDGCADDSVWSQQRLGSAVSAVALVLLVESLVGHAATILAFALVVAIALCGRVNRPLLLLGATVLLAADTLALAPIAASAAPRSVTWATLAVWGLEGLLINALLVEILAVALGRRPSGKAVREPSHLDQRRLNLLLESSSESKERFRLMVESIRDYAIVMLDNAGRIVSWNAGAERILGYSSSEILGRDHARLYLSEDVRRGIPRRTLEESHSRETYEVEGWRRRKDGKRLWARVGMSPLRSGSGTLCGFAMIIRDITARKRAERSLRRARDELEVRVRERTAELAEANRALQAEVLERNAAQEVLRQQSAVLRSILDSIGDAIIVAEGPGRPLIFNPAARQFFAVGTEPVSIDQWLDMSTIRVVNETDRADAERPLARALRGEEVDDVELTVKSPESGQQRWVLASGRPLRDPGGVSSGAVIAFRDITERRRDAQELKEAKEAAEAASRAKDQFLAVLSHELRTPLTPALLAVADLVGKDDLDHEVRSALAVVHRNIEVESRLIDDLLDLSRAGTGRLTLDVSSVDAHRIIQHAADVCRAALDDSELELHLELTAPRHDVSADPARLQQVFWNLIQNAVKFTPRGGLITVRTLNAPAPTTEGQDTVWIAEVADNGIGIEPDRLPRIFNAFEPRDPVLRRRYGGLGLGLAISQSVVEAHGGRLTASSAGKNQGTSFTIELAALPGPIPSLVTADTLRLLPRHDPQPRPEGLNLLLIEDNTDTLQFLARLMRERGYAVSTATDFRTARELATSAVFDLIISDIELPDGCGLEIIREVTQIRPTPAIALSGFGSAEDVILSRDAGFAAHLTKPIRIGDLDAAIAQVMARTAGDSPPRTPLAPQTTGTIPAADPDVALPRPGLGPVRSYLCTNCDVETAAGGKAWTTQVSSQK
jgi:PAS domain S-box-containing protein